MKVRKSLGDLGGADGGKQSVSLHPNHLKSLLKKHFNLYGMPSFLVVSITNYLLTVYSFNH